MTMLGTLIQKQLLELYRGFFVNQKKGSVRSRLGVAVYFVLYAGLILGVVGGAFFALAKGLCEPLCTAGLTWLYFALFAALALVLGVFPAASPSTPPSMGPRTMTFCSPCRCRWAISSRPGFSACISWASPSP